MPEKCRTSPIRRLAAGLSLLTLTVVGLSLARTHASLPVPIWDDYQELSSIAAAQGGGFWVQRDQGRGWNNPSGPWIGTTAARDGAPEFKSVSEPGSIGAIPGRNGYWVVSAWGGIFARGDALELCGGQLSNCSGFPNAAINLRI
jgi:hypothetical protein